MPECIAAQAVLDFHPDARIVVKADAPRLSSDGGWLLLRAIDEASGLLSKVARLLPDPRRSDRLIHSREEQLRQRVYQIAMGYEDCNDASDLRHDPVLKTACDCAPDEQRGLSSQPTLSRFENGFDGGVVGHVLRELEAEYVGSLARDCELVVLDIDSTDDQTHGQQQLSMFNAFFGHHVYHPLLVFEAGSGQLVSAVLRGGRSHAGRGARGVLRRLVRAIRRRCPHAQIVLRADSAFASPRILEELEALERELGDVYYLLGFAKNSVLLRSAADSLERARAECAVWGRKATHFTKFQYRAHSWERARLIVAKAEHSAQGANPRFVVTNIEGFDAEMLYRAYCERGNCENRIKDFKNALAADRLSCSGFKANFFRLLLHALAYRLMHALRATVATVSAELGVAQFDTLRLKLLKVGALVSRSVRRILVRLPESFPLKAVFFQVAAAAAFRPAPS